MSDASRKTAPSIICFDSSESLEVEKSSRFKVQGARIIGVAKQITVAWPRAFSMEPLNTPETILRACSGIHPIPVNSTSKYHPVLDVHLSRG